MAEVVIKVTCNAGGAGTSTGTGTSEVPVRGFLEAVETEYGSAPVTTTVTITENDKLGRSLLAIPAGNTASILYPRAAAVNQSGAAITNSFARLYLVGYSVNVAIAAANSNNVVIVHLYISEVYRE